MEVNHTGKYRPLWTWLRSRPSDRARVSFQEIEEILGFSLPPSSRNYLAHWYSYGGSAVGRAIQDAGWRATAVNLTAETVELVKGSAGETLASHLERRQIDEAICELLLGLAQESTIEPCGADTHHFPLSVAHDAYAAVYVGRRDLTIALDPRDARRAHERHGFRLEAKNDTTAHVHITPEHLADPALRAAVRTITQQAFSRAFQGPRWNRGLPDRSLQRGNVCPNCQMEMPLVGPCDNCG